MDQGAGNPDAERWEAGRRYFNAIKEREKNYAGLPPKPSENVQKKDGHLASHPNQHLNAEPNKRQRTRGTYRSPRTGSGPPADTPRGPRGAAQAPVFRNYDASIVGGFQEVFGVTRKHNNASNRQAVPRAEAALPSHVGSFATQAQESFREGAAVRDSENRSSVSNKLTAPTVEVVMPASAAKNPTIKQEDEGNISKAVTHKSILPEAASRPFMENQKSDYFQRSIHASLAGGKETWEKRKEETKHALLDVVDPIIDGDHTYLIKLDYRPSFRASYLGAGPGEESVAKVAEELGVKLRNKYKTQQLHVWAEPVLHKGEVSSGPAKARCEHALAFLEFWRWRVLKDESKNRPSCSLTDACVWFHDLDSIEVMEWLRETGRRSDPREAPLIIH